MSDPSADPSTTGSAAGSTELPPVVLQYLTTQAAARQQRVAGKWAALSAREQALVREAAVLGFVQGTMHGRDAACPKDSVIVGGVLADVDTFEDLYPTLAALGND